MLTQKQNLGSLVNTFSGKLTNSDCFVHVSKQIISTNIVEAYEITKIENSITSIQMLQHKTQT